jgi:hypothetical protein
MRLRVASESLYLSVACVRTQLSQARSVAALIRSAVCRGYGGGGGYGGRGGGGTLARRARGGGKSEMEERRERDGEPCGGTG